MGLGETPSTMPVTKASTLPMLRPLVWNEYSICLVLSVYSAPLHPPWHPRADRHRRARCEASGTDPLAQSCPGGGVGGGAVTADGRASRQIPETRPAVGVSRGEAVV